MKIVGIYFLYRDGHKHVCTIKESKHESVLLFDELVGSIIKDVLLYERKVVSCGACHVIIHNFNGNIAAMVTDLEFSTSAAFELLQSLHNTPTRDSISSVLHDCQNCRVLPDHHRAQLPTPLVVTHDDVSLTTLETVVKQSELDLSSKLLFSTTVRETQCSTM